MAQKKKTKTAKSTSSSSNVTRVRATDAGSTKKPKTEVKKSDKKVVEAEVVSTPAKKADKPKRKVSIKKPKGLRVLLVPFIALGGYFKGAWRELKQVRWPTRKATWSMTAAVLVYSAFFTVLVLLLDAGFKYVFELMIVK